MFLVPSVVSVREKEKSDRDWEGPHLIRPAMCVCLRSEHMVDMSRRNLLVQTRFEHVFWKYAWVQIRSASSRKCKAKINHLKTFWRSSLDYQTDQRNSGNDVTKLATRVCCFLSCCPCFVPLSVPIFQNKAHCSIMLHFMTFKQSLQTPVTLLYFILYSRLNRSISKHKKQQQQR